MNYLAAIELDTYTYLFIVLNDEYAQSDEIRLKPLKPPMSLFFKHIKYQWWTNCDLSAEGQ